MKQPARRKRRAKGGDDGGTVPPDKNDFFKKRTLKMHTIVATDEAEEDVTIMPSFAGWTFACLGTYVRTHEYMEDATTLFTVTLPYMVSTALALPLLFPSHVPLLTRQVPSSVTLTKRQAACLIIHAFLCTFTAANPSFNHFHFFDVFAPSAPPPWSNAAATDQDEDATAVQKLLTVLHYFSRFTTDNLCDNTNHQYDQQVITYARHVLDTTTPWTEGGMAGDGGGWADTLPWSPVQVHANGAIEDDVGAVQVDFANKFAGGGVLGHGCVQEEIRFLMNPECLVACLLTEVLGTRSIPSRELDKAMVGFQRLPDESPTQRGRRPVATGNWGCGVFKGDVELKFVVQWLAASAQHRPLHYYTFGNSDLATRLAQFIQTVTTSTLSVAQLRARLLDNNAPNCTLSLAEYTRQHRRHRPSVCAYITSTLLPHTGHSPSTVSQAAADVQSTD
ncbi:hypothetical protein DYB31_010035 [Aphanomyces astaci]|uniref:poly(ADP-ribose) glycohydrolase n=1 Tax=Aphanomyces astaci TaxID=112090 RepID=A0A397FDJ2_APHAT|nr:hypothetical protein DYB31_010035 [Aphanomyces astaci]